MTRDRDLQNAVLAELSWEPTVTAAHIGITANEGVVSLSGHVSSFGDRHAAEIATWRVRGVKAVVETSEVRLPEALQWGDEAIAAKAVNRLAWHKSDPECPVHVRVESGWVTLTGQVDWQFQRKAAGDEISRLPGVVGLDNSITIKPQVVVSSLGDDITHALHRSWFFDPKTITVRADGGTVRLTGTVHSPHERQLAATTAWAAPGVTSVENHLAMA